MMEERVGSDHHPIIVSIEGKEERRRKREQRKRKEEEKDIEEKEERILGKVKRDDL